MGCSVLKASYSAVEISMHMKVKKYFKELERHLRKYIDPTYIIRACHANASDGILCTVLGQNAFKTEFIIFVDINNKEITDAHKIKNRGGDQDENKTNGCSQRVNDDIVSESLVAAAASLCSASFSVSFAVTVAGLRLRTQAATVAIGVEGDSKLLGGLEEDGGKFDPSRSDYHWSGSEAQGHLSPIDLAQVAIGIGFESRDEGVLGGQEAQLKEDDYLHKTRPL
ncbi:hypothetical protein HAX54_032252 [Datura stramonium]|uniref:Uncharacterized protein n=1 Tax=Datura stramonium TaxID=4076 RepID=A0ABS8RLG6_DATST|nr:hypothetical protein [Datura stramonium]